MCEICRLGRTLNIAEQKKTYQLFSFQTLSNDRIFFFISTNIKHDLTSITAVHLL